MTWRSVLVTVAALGAGTDIVTAQAPSMTNTIGMDFVLIAPGEMVVGRFEPPYPAADGTAFARRAEQMARADVTPGFRVRIERSFYIGRFEVTRAQWRAVMGGNPSAFRAGDAARLPVDSVTWDDAQAFIRTLNAREHTDVYRLPAEFEWEYAARAGGDADLPWAEIRNTAIAGYNAYTTTHPVGEKMPNAWGLYDMLGNVWEWVQDFYNEKIFADPVPPASGRVHVLKGGGFAADVKNAIPATHAAGPGSGFDVGFRILREVR